MLTDAQARELYPQLRHYAATLARHDVDDLVQSAFLGLLRRPVLPENVVGFLTTSVRNAAYSRRRHERCLRVDSLDVPARGNEWDAEYAEAVTPLHARLAGPDDVAEEATTLAALAGALAALAGTPYAPAVLALGRGWHYREVAERQGVSIMAVKSGVNRLRHGPLARLSPF